MTNKNTKSGSASASDATAAQTLTAQVNEFQNKRARFKQLHTKMEQFARLNSDLETLNSAKISGSELGDEDEVENVSKIVLQFDGQDRYKNTYEIKNPTIMAEVVEQLKARFKARATELESEIINFAI